MHRDVPILAQDFRDFIASLEAHQVVSILVGGFALGYHGVVRATSDIDFLYDRSPKNVSRLCSALTEFGAPPHVIDPEFMQHADAITMIGQPPLRIDLLASISGVSFSEVRAGALSVEVDGHPLLVIGLAALKTNKAATDRVKDREDLRRLEAVRE
ncbi:MAG: hypothetical protein H0W15_09700 [Gemmatimonadales bacterium]|nr:hypothetical protein [Gemmatimonadales bacterium]